MWKLIQVYRDKSQYTRLYSKKPTLKDNVDDSAGYVFLEEVKENGSNVTVEELCRAIDSYMENWNHHDRVGEPGELVDYLRETCMTESQIIKLYIKMVNNKVMGWNID